MSDKPKVVCLCGSTRFRTAFELAMMDETLQGNIVISVGMFGHDDYPKGAAFLIGNLNDSFVKMELDQLHLRKIDLADEILVINVGGYIGDSTRAEMGYAASQGKSVRMMFR